MYTLSDKQKQALINMWAVLGLDSDSVEDYFLDKDAFQKYFDWFKEQIEKKIKSQKRSKNFNKAVAEWRVDLEKVRENKEKRILEYYNKPEVLKQKWLEYHIKYATSKKRLEEWMLKKSGGNTELVSQVLSDCRINERIFIQPQVQYWIKRGKSDFDISMKLSQKWFDRDLIEQIIQEEKESKEVELSPNVVHIKIKELLRKWNARSGIESELKYKFNLSKESVAEYLSEYDFDNNVQWDLKLQKEIESLRRKWKNNFDIMRVCISKKFDYKKISEYLKK